MLHVCVYGCGRKYSVHMRKNTAVTDIYCICFSVVEWGIACPSYGKTSRNADDVKRDARWALQRQQKQQILMSYNKVRYVFAYVYMHECMCAYVYMYG
jgi:hypothetical protein